MSSYLDISADGRVQRINLNRPEKRNAINAGLCLALVDAIEAADRNPAVGAILLTASGKTFCAGMDLAEIGEGSPEGLDDAHERLFTSGARITTPIVAAVGGAALGGGTGLVANCHIVVAGPEATFGLTEIRIGLWPFLVFRAVAAAIGERQTLALSLTGRLFPAAEARELGIVQEIAADPEARALEIARTVAAFSPTSTRAGMSHVHQIRGIPWVEAGAIGRKIRNEVFRSADFREGIDAFLQKRPPKWPSLE